MVRIEIENGSRQSIEVDGGGDGRRIMLRVKVEDKDAERTMASVSLSPEESEAVENALRIQRRAADLEEAHEPERSSGHGGDGARGCSYCIDLRKVKKAHAALARLGFAAPTGREEGGA